MAGVALVDPCVVAADAGFGGADVLFVHTMAIGADDFCMPLCEPHDFVGIYLSALGVR